MTTKADTDSKKLVAMFGALGDGTRFKLLQLLGTDKELCVSELASEVGISSAGVSQQLKVLEQAGLIERHRMGQKICYKIIENDPTNRTLLNLIK